MRILLLTLLLSTLGNDDVVRLVKAGLSAETIEAKIGASETSFDISTDALVKLAEAGVPDRVIQKMIIVTGGAPPASGTERAPAAEAAAAPQVPVPTRRYDVTLLGENGGKCEGELRIDGKGIKATRCRSLDFELPWSAVETACHDYGFHGSVVVNGHRISITTPAEAKRIVEHLRAAKVAVASCGAR